MRIDVAKVRSLWHAGANSRASRASFFQALEQMAPHIGENAIGLQRRAGRKA
jgi:hypothetical protein